MKKYFFLTIFFASFFFASKALANTCVAAAGAAGNWTSAAAWTSCGGVAPTAADDAQIGAGTTSITIDAGALARSADFNGFTGVLTQGATGTLTLGDATAGLSNIALNIPAGMIYAPNSASTISFVSSSATLQTITISSTYTAGNLTFGTQTVSVNYAITANLTTAAASTVTVTKGTVHFDGATDNSGLTHSFGALSSRNNATARVITLGTATINLTVGSNSAALDFTNATTNLTFNANTSTVNVTGNNSVQVIPSGKTFNILNLTGSGTYSVAALTAATFNRTGTNAKTDILSLTGDVTVTATTTLAGNSITNRLLVQSGTIGTSRAITITGTTGNAYSNVDFKDIDLHDGAGQVDLSAISGNSGNAGGNNLTDMKFTTSQTQYWKHSNDATSHNWSDMTGSNPTYWFTTSGGLTTGRVPLPQDDVCFDANSFPHTGSTVTLDMPRAGTNIDFAGTASICGAGEAAVTNTPAWAKTLAGGGSTIYGSVTLTAGMTNSGTGGIVFEGRGPFTFTSAGLTWTNSSTIQMVGGTLTMQDAFNTSGSITISLSSIFSANNFSITATTITTVGSYNGTINMGSGTWTLTSTGTVWNSIGSGYTLNANTSTIVVSNTTATAKTFAGAGKTFNNVTMTGDNITVTGSNTFNTVAVNNAGLANGLLLTAGTTQTVRNMTTNATTTGATAILKSATASSKATIQKAGGSTVCVDFMTVTDITGVPANTWYMGANSTLLRTISLLNTACPAVPAVNTKGTTIQNSKILIKNSKVKIQPQ